LIQIKANVPKAHRIDDAMQRSSRMVVIQEGTGMPSKLDALLPDAKELRKRAARREATKADEYVRRLTEAELEKRALVEALGKTRDALDEEKIKLSSAIIQRAASSGLCEVELCRFSNVLCTDGGLAISKDAAGWEDTLTAVPQEIYRLWSIYLQPRGYKIRYLLNALPSSLPNNISIVVSWGDEPLVRDPSDPI
jgi:hypothetical protein